MHMIYSYNVISHGKMSRQSGMSVLASMVVMGWKIDPLVSIAMQLVIGFSVGWDESIFQIMDLFSIILIYYTGKKK